MTNIHRLPLPKRLKATDSGYVDPHQLHDVLPPTQVVVITFAKENEMWRYRRLLYSINAQGKYRYRTIRDEYSMWGIVIWRMR